MALCQFSIGSELRRDDVPTAGMQGGRAGVFEYLAVSAAAVSYTHLRAHET